MNRYEEQGRFDAQRGVTTCPYGIEANARQWAKGHDAIVDQGLGPHPRFGRICPRRPKQQPGLDL